MGTLPVSLILEATLRSIAIALATAGLAGALGLLMAWLVSRTDFPGRARLAGLLAIPYALPSYLLGMAWVVLGNPTVGLLKDFLPAQGSYGFWGIVFVESCVAFAFPYLELRAGFERLDPALEEAARMSGASPARVFRDVSFPLLRPALFNGMALAFLYAMAAFGVPALLGLPVRQFTLTTLIFSQIRLGGAEGIASALWLSGLLLAISAIAIGALRAFGQGRFGARAISGAKSSRASRIALGPARYAATALVIGTTFLTVVLPWAALALSALAPVAGEFHPSRWTTRHLVEVVTMPDFRDALANSAMLALLAATSTVLLGFVLGFLAVRRKQRLARVVIETLGIPFATPGTVVAMVLIFATSALGRIGVDTDMPRLFLGIAYAIKYAAVAARSIATAYGQVDPALEEAARVAGASTNELLRTIWFPLLRRHMAAAWVLTALPMLTELTMSVLLTGPGAATLGTLLFDLQEYRDQPTAAALAWILLNVAIVTTLLTRSQEKPA